MGFAINICIHNSDPPPQGVENRNILLWFSAGTPVSSTNKTDHHDITEILLKVALKTIHQW
jgi:hypothetical protein